MTTKESAAIPTQPRGEFLDTALSCGAILTGKPDGSEAITVVFTIEAWRKFDSAALALGADKATDERALFEKWYSDDGKWPRAIDRSGEGYALMQVNTAWMVWKARAALAAGAPVRDDLQDWKNRALLAEESCRRLTAVLNAENGPTHMGEPSIAPDGERDAKDAIRYRWLRDPENCEGPNYVAAFGKDDLDGTIDAAITAAAPSEQSADPMSPEILAAIVEAGSIVADPEFVNLLFAWHVVERSAKEFAPLIAYIDSIIAAARKAAPAKLTEERILEIRDSIKPGDGWDGDDWDVALVRAIESALTGQSGAADTAGGGA